MAQQNALTVADATSPVMQHVATAKVAALIDNYLIGTDLTGKRLIADLMVQMTLNPKLQRCTPQSLFQCLVFAAQRKRSFGPYGVWIVPRDVKDDDGVKALTAIPQLSYQAKNTSAREKGAEQVQSEVVLKDEAFEVIRDAGVIVDIKHTIDYLSRPKPTTANVVGGWGVVAMPGGGRFFRVLTKHDLERSHTASPTRTGGPWISDYEAMCRKTIEHRMNEDFVGDFTQYGGGVGAEPPPVQVALPPGETKADLADELFARVENLEPTILERAQMIFEVCETPEQVAALKKSEDFKSVWLKATPDERDQIGSMGQKRMATLEAAAQARAEQPAQEQAGADTPAPMQSPNADTAADELAARVADPAAEVQGDAAPTLPTPEAEEGQDGPQDDSHPAKDGEQAEPVAPPAFPALPAQVSKYINTAGSVLQRIDQEVRGQWMGLGQQPDAVAGAIKAHKNEWAKLLIKATPGESNAFSTYQKAILAALKVAGLPCEV